MDRRAEQRPGGFQELAFSYGVHPVDLAERCLRERDLTGDRVMLVTGPSQRNPNASHRIEIMRLSPA